MSIVQGAKRRVLFSTLSIVICVTDAESALQPPTSDQIWKWSADFASARSFRCSLRFDGLPEISETDQPSVFRMLRTIQVRWPDAAIWTSAVWQPGRDERSSKPKSEFHRLFRPDASVSASSDRGSIVTSTTPSIFAEDAWRYSYVSPWFFAKLMQSESQESVSIKQGDESTNIELTELGVSATFEFNQVDDQVRLVAMRIIERGSEIETSYRYSDFRGGGPQGRSVPWRISAVGNFHVVDPRTKKISVSGQREVGTGVLIFCEWPDSIDDSEFQFPADIQRTTKRASLLNSRTERTAELPSPTVASHTSRGSKESGDNAPASLAPVQARSPAWLQWALIVAAGGCFASATWWMRRHVFRP